MSDYYYEAQAHCKAVQTKMMEAMDFFKKEHPGNIRTAYLDLLGTAEFEERLENVKEFIQSVEDYKNWRKKSA